MDDFNIFIFIFSILVLVMNIVLLEKDSKVENEENNSYEERDGNS